MRRLVSAELSGAEVAERGPETLDHSRSPIDAAELAGSNGERHARHLFGLRPRAGLTGVTFTDPVALTEECGIPNHLPRKRELSSIYIYDMIHHMGGPAEFYQQFFLSAVCPLGFTRKGVNLNYYDTGLERAVTPFIVSSVERHIAFGCRRDHVVILGRGSNARFFARLNDEYHWSMKYIRLIIPAS